MRPVDRFLSRESLGQKLWNLPVIKTYNQNIFTERMIEETGSQSLRSKALYFVKLLRMRSPQDTRDRLKSFRTG